MLFAYYHETLLEQWINTKCLNHGIASPADLDIERVAEAFGVELVYESCPSFSDNEEKVIFLNKYKDAAEARVIFFHELCHVLRHAGDQRRMTALFKKRPGKRSRAVRAVCRRAVLHVRQAARAGPSRRSDSLYCRTISGPAYTSRAAAGSNPAAGAARQSNCGGPGRESAAKASGSRMVERNPKGAFPTGASN